MERVLGRNMEEEEERGRERVGGRQKERETELTGKSLLKNEIGCLSCLFKVLKEKRIDELQKDLPSCFELKT